MAQVKGVVIDHDDRPVAGATVTFIPQGGGRPASGVTDEAGRFALSTFEPGDGALVGTHGVAIACVRITASPPVANRDGENLQPPDAKHTVEWLTPQKYANASTSGLVADVKPGMDVLNFKLE